MTAQSVILPLPSDHARFIVLRLKDLTIAELKKQLEALFETRDRLITQHSDAQIKTAVALVQNFGSNFTVNLLLVLNNLNQKMAHSICQSYQLMCLFTLPVCVLISVLH